MIPNPLISVIVPVYKVERYLRQCVDSILAQTYSNLEIWLIDDGSPDNCPKICDEYAKLDKRIKVIHKDNGGLADARNAALDKLTGDYVVCVDSDDYISNTHIEGLYNLLKQNDADVAINTYCTFSGHVLPKPRKPKDKVYVYDNLHAIETMFYQKQFDTSAWGKLYKKDLFDNIRYPKGIVFEDLPTTYRLFLKAKKIVFQNIQSYYYLIRSNSIEGASFTPSKLDSGMQLITMMEIDKKVLKPIIKSLNCRIASFSFHLMLQMPEGYQGRWEFEKRIRRVRWEILTNRRARIKTRVACLLTYFGDFEIVQKIFNKVKSR